MLRRALVPLLVTTVLCVGAAAPNSIVKWPPWLSIESPVNPWDAASHGVAFYVHTALREGVPSLSDMSGTADGVVNGERRTIPLQLASTSRPGVFSVRRTWPADGAWVLRISLHSTTAIVSIDRNGNVGAARIPTEATPGGVVPRAVSQREVDSTLAELAKR